MSTNNPEEQPTGEPRRKEILTPNIIEKLNRLGLLAEIAAQNSFDALPESPISRAFRAMTIFQKLPDSAFTSAEAPPITDLLGNFGITPSQWTSAETSVYDMPEDAYTLFERELWKVQTQYQNTSTAELEKMLRPLSEQEPPTVESLMSNEPKLSEIVVDGWNRLHPQDAPKTLKGLLYQLYFIQNLPGTVIAEKFGVNSSTVYKWLVRSGYKPRTDAEVQAAKKGKGEKQQLVVNAWNAAHRDEGEKTFEEILKRLYVEENRTGQTIARMFGVPERRVYRWLNEIVSIKTPEELYSGAEGQRRRDEQSKRSKAYFAADPTRRIEATAAGRAVPRTPELLQRQTSGIIEAAKEKSRQAIINNQPLILEATKRGDINRLSGIQRQAILQRYTPEGDILPNLREFTTAENRAFGRAIQTLKKIGRQGQYLPPSQETK